MIMEEEKNREKLNIQDDPETAVIRETPEETDKPKYQEVPETADVPEAVEGADDQAAPEAAEATDSPEDQKESDEQKSPKKKKRRSKRKLKQFIFVGMLAIAALLCLLIAFRLLDVDSRFVRAVNAGLSESWALENNEIQLKENKAPYDTSFVDIEYDKVKEFKDKKFRDESLGKLAGEYIAALEGCRTAIKENDPGKDYDKFWGAFSQSYGQRVEAIYDLYSGDYGIEIEDPEAKEEIDELKLSAWSLKKTADIKFTRVKGEENKTENEGEGETETETEAGSGLDTALQATVTNDSGFDLEYINIEVELYDEKGELIETATAYAENIKNKAKFDLSIYQTTETQADAYKITSVLCHRKEDAKPEAENKEKAEAGAPEKDAADEKTPASND